jgi:DNA-binding transcriptional LysR family regulator
MVENTMINPNTFDLNLIRVFVALARDRSVSLAANRLGLSQPAVSNALNRLRELFSDPLFVRTRQGMEPTALARSLEHPLEQTLVDIRTALGRSVKFDPTTAIRTFTLIMIDVGETALLPSLLARLTAEAPSISLRVLDVSRQNYEDYLDSGVADMVIGDVTLSDTFRSRLLFESQPVALLDRSHPFIDVAPNQILSIGHDHYLEAQHVAIVPRGTIDSQLEACLGSEAQRRNIKLSIPHTAVLSVILPGTELIATVPDVTAIALLRDPRLCCVALPFPVEARRVFLWWHKRQDDDQGHGWLRQALTDARVDRNSVSSAE